MNSRKLNAVNNAVKLNAEIAAEAAQADKLYVLWVLIALWKDSVISWWDGYWWSFAVGMEDDWECLVPWGDDDYGGDDYGNPPDIETLQACKSWDEMLRAQEEFPIDPEVLRRCHQQAAEDQFDPEHDAPLPFDPIPAEMPLPVTLPEWSDEWEDIHRQQFVRSVW